jgi:hypothetical protein
LEDKTFPAASSAYLSKDGKGVFVGVPGMKPVQQLRIGWSLATTSATWQTRTATR